ETPMTTETTSMLDSVKEAFAPMTEAFKNLQTMEVPEAAREFVKKTANTASNIQQAMYQDAEAFFEGLDKLASAKTISEAVQIQSEMVRARSEAFVSRAKSTTE